MGATVRVFALKGYGSSPPAIAATVRVFGLTAITAAPPTPPTANAGSDVTGVEPWTVLPLNGSSSTAAGSAFITEWNWTQSDGTIAIINGENTATPSVEVPGHVAGETLVFTLTVTDSNGAVSNEDTVSITTLPATELTVANGVLVPIKISRVTA